VQFIFTFETARTQPDPQTDLTDVAYDYSWFDQDTEETSIRSALDAICTTIATLLGVTMAEVQAVVTVRRQWSFALDQQGSAAPQQLGVIGTEVPVLITHMPYPAAAAALSGTGSAAAAEG
jgi:hypothetical protein